MFIEIHSIDSDKDIIINTQYITEIENRSDGGTDVWLATTAPAPRLVRTSTNRQDWIAILDVR